jgi:hypothetical protein
MYCKCHTITRIYQQILGNKNQTSIIVPVACLVETVTYFSIIKSVLENV